MRQVFLNVFVLFRSYEQDEASINNNFWIYPQNQATMRKVQYKFMRQIKALSFQISLIDIEKCENCTPSLQDVDISL